MLLGVSSVSHHTIFSVVGFLLPLFSVILSITWHCNDVGVASIIIYYQAVLPFNVHLSQHSTASLFKYNLHICPSSLSHLWRLAIFHPFIFPPCLNMKVRSWALDVTSTNDHYTNFPGKLAAERIIWTIVSWTIKPNSLIGKSMVMWARVSLLAWVNECACMCVCERACVCEWACVCVVEVGRNSGSKEGAEIHWRQARPSTLFPSGANWCYCQRLFTPT